MVTDLKLALARASKHARQHPGDSAALAELARAREQFTTALAEQRLHAVIDGANLSLASRRRLVDAVMTG